MEIATVIPLGSRCRLTHNLRQHFGFSRGYPFDWYILPLHGLVEILQGGLDAAAIYDPAALKARRDASGRIDHIHNRRFGIKHEHDFPKRKEEGVLPGWETLIPKAAARFAALAGRLRETPPEGGTVLFVREFLKHDQPEALAVLRAELALLQPEGGFRLLAVNYPDGSVPAGIETLQVTEQPGFGWRGDPDAWSAALGSTGYRLRKAALAA